MHSASYHSLPDYEDTVDYQMTSFKIYKPIFGPDGIAPVIKHTNKKSDRIARKG
jgi:hypothetical protein